MIALSTTQPVRFTPSWLEGKDGAPVYLLRAGSVIEREMLEADMAGLHRADRVSRWELDEAAREGVARIVSAPEDQARIIAAMDAEAALEEGETLPAEEAELLTEVRRMLGESWPDYRALMGQLARRNTILPLEAFRRFCTGWEGCEATYGTGFDRRVTEAALIEVPAMELRAAGVEAYRMLYAASAEKNSGPPSKSRDGRRTSRAGGGSKAAGKSTATGGAKIPG